MDEVTTLPRDTYSSQLRNLSNINGAIVKTSTIDLQDFLGNAETWTVKTIRWEGRDVVFLQRINSQGGDRWVLPEEVTAAIARQRDGAVAVVRRVGGHKAAATRKAAKR